MIFNVCVQPQKSHRKDSEGPSSDFPFRKNDHRDTEKLLLPVTELHACALGHPELELKGRWNPLGQVLQLSSTHTSIAHIRKQNR